MSPALPKLTQEDVSFQRISERCRLKPLEDEEHEEESST
jgi:hypothetical protein